MIQLSINFYNLSSSSPPKIFLYYFIVPASELISFVLTSVLQAFIKEITTTISLGISRKDKYLMFHPLRDSDAQHYTVYRPVTDVENPTEVIKPKTFREISFFRHRNSSHFRFHINHLLGRSGVASALPLERSRAILITSHYIKIPAFHNTSPIKANCPRHFFPSPARGQKWNDGGSYCVQLRLAFFHGNSNALFAVLGSDVRRSDQTTKREFQISLWRLGILTTN